MIKNIKVMIRIEDEDGNTEEIKVFDMEDMINRERIMQRNQIAFSDLKINVTERTVISGKKRINLIAKEFDILFLLAEYSGQVLSYSQIYEKVWGEQYAYEKNLVMTHVSHLRAKIETNAEGRNYIENIRGIGYRLKKS